MVVDVDKLSDAEIRTKLMEYGFPVMPITGTTRKLMVKKLKLLIENQKKSATQDRRSLAKYSSEEESDQEVVGKSVKKNTARRATMAAPPAKIVAPKKNVAAKTNDSDNDSEKSVTTTREIKVVTTKRSKIVKPIDEFDTGSESESELNNQSTSKLESPSTKSSLFERKPLSPSRYTSYTTSSPASDAAEQLNQIRSRLSLGASTSYDRRSYTPSPPEKREDTPFLSNFTKRLSQLSTRNTYDDAYKSNDVIKEHDTYGGSGSGTSYLRNYANRLSSRRELASRDFDTNQGENIVRNNFVSFSVLVLAFLLFIAIAIMYLHLKIDYANRPIADIIPFCNKEKGLTRPGIDCLILERDAVRATDVYKILKPQLRKLAVDRLCNDPNTRHFMSDAQAVEYLYRNYFMKDKPELRKILQDFELLALLNEHWDVHIYKTDEIAFKNEIFSMEELLEAKKTEAINFAIVYADVPYSCLIYAIVTYVLTALSFLALFFLVVYLLLKAYKYYNYYQVKRNEEICSLVENIIDVLRSSAVDEGKPFMVINHLRDMILPIHDRKRLESRWNKAVKFIRYNDSRVRTELELVHGEPYEVWRWLGGATPAAVAAVLNNSNSSSIGLSNLSSSSAAAASPRSKSWQGQAFETQTGSVNSLQCSPTPCLKIRGMIDDCDRNYFHTIRDAVLSKCANQCRILHCVVEPITKCVYLKCEDTSDAAIAYRNLHGWWYAGHLVTVKYIRLERYMQRFPDAPISGPPYLKAATTPGGRLDN